MVLKRFILVVYVALKEVEVSGARQPIKMKFRRDLWTNNTRLGSSLKVLTQVVHHLDPYANQFEIECPLLFQVNLDVPIIEGKINIDAIDNWNQSKSHFTMNDFSYYEKIMVILLRVSSLMNKLCKAYNLWDTRSNEKNLNKLGNRF